MRLTVSSDIGRNVRELRVRVENCGERPVVRSGIGVRERGSAGRADPDQQRGRSQGENPPGRGRDTPAAVAAMRVEEIQSLLNVNESLAETIRDSAPSLATEWG